MLSFQKLGISGLSFPKGKLLADIQPHGVSIKAATVSKEPDGSYRISLRMESVIDKPVFPTFINSSEIVSVDLDLKDFGVFGNLEESIPVSNPRWIKVHAKRLRRFQQSLSRKQYDHKTHTGSKTGRKPGLRLLKSSVRLLTREGIFTTNSQERLRIIMLHSYVKTLRSRT